MDTNLTAKKQEIVDQLKKVIQEFPTQTLTGPYLKSVGYSSYIYKIRRYLGGMWEANKILGLLNTKRKKGWANNLEDLLKEAANILKAVGESNFTHEYIIKSEFSYFLDGCKKHGGLNAVKQAMGLKLINRPAGWANDLDTFLAYGLEIKSKIGDRPFTQSVLIELGYGHFCKQCSKHGGFRKVVELLGIKPKQKCSGWADDINDLLKYGHEILNQVGEENFTQDKLLKSGFGDFIGACQKHGTLVEIKHLLGIKLLQKPSGWADDLNDLLQYGKEILDQLGEERFTHDELQKEGFTDFISACKKHGGLVSVKEALGIKLHQRKNGWSDSLENVLNHGREILESIGPENFNYDYLTEHGYCSFTYGCQKHGGIREIKKLLGLKSPRKAGWANDLEAVLSECRGLIKSRGEDFLTTPNLEAAGYRYLLRGLAKHGGLAKIRLDLGIEGKQKPNGTFDNLKALLEYGRKILETIDEDHFTIDTLIENGFRDFTKAVQKHGGFVHVKSLLGICPLKSPNAKKRAKNIAFVKEYLASLKLEIDAHGTYGLSVTQMLVILRQGFGKAGVEDINTLPDAAGGDLIKQLLSGELTPDTLMSWGSGEDAEPQTLPQDKLDDSKTHSDFHADEASSNGETAESGSGTDEEPYDGIRSSDLFQPKVVDNQLEVLDAMAFLTDDSEAIEFMKRETKRELWNCAYKNDEGLQYVIKRCKEVQASKPWTQAVQTEMLSTVQQIQNLCLPDEFNYTVNGQLVNPTTMQRHVVIETSRLKELLVMSEMGTGKSLAAQLTVVNHGCHNTVVIAKSECVSQWVSDFTNQWRDINVSELTLEEIKSQAFKGQIKTERKNVIVIASHLFSYLTDEQVAWLSGLVKYDGLILDEIHVFKSRDEGESNRKRQVTKFLTTVKELNPGRIVLGLSGTVIVNAISEAQSLLELVTCVERPDLAKGRGLEKEQRVHQALMANGIRQRSLGVEIPIRLNQPKVDLTHLEEEVKEIIRYPAGYQISQFERLFIEPAVPTIIDAINGPTIIATQYTTDIVEPIQRGLEQAGISYGINTGDSKEPCRGFSSAVEAFKAGAIDVLIGSVETICTGIDGFQNVCSNMIIASLPWTAANYQQLLKRIARTGQKAKEVTVTIPLLYFEYFEDGEDRVWSYSDYRRSVIAKKQRLMDAVIDGQIASSVTEKLTQAEINEGVCMWFKRVCQDNQVVELQQRPLQVPLTFQSPTQELKARRHFGDFSRINGRWNSSSSTSLHTRLLSNPQEWELYHTELESLRSGWSVDPLQECINYLSQSSGYRVADFGCGTAQLAEALKGRHTVHSFDHIAYTDDVISCDIAESVPLEDGSVDIGVFSLSLMGSNWKQQLVEAKRCLTDIGQLIIWNAASSIDAEELTAALEEAGFKVYEVLPHDKWIYIRAAAAMPAFAPVVKAA